MTDKVTAFEFTFQSAAVANGNGTAADVGGLAAVGVQVEGITTATVNFEATIDGSTWYAVQGVNLNDGAVATSTTADALFLVPVAGVDQLRCRISGWSVGTITVTGKGVVNPAGVTLADIDIAGSETVDIEVGGQAPQLDDTDKLAVSLYGKNSAAGDIALNASAAGNLEVDIVADPYAVFSVGDSVNWGTLSTLVVANIGEAFNGTTYDRQRNNQEVSLLASAARTAEADSADQVNHNGSGLLIYVDWTSETDTVTLTPRLQVKDSIGGGYFTVWTAAANLTATGDYVYLFQPGGAAGSYTEAVNLRVGRTWRFQMGVGDADSATYSVSAVVLV